jgi:ubiquinone/menaquinone biosynthesis C-methylase UbiE
MGGTMVKDYSTLVGIVKERNRPSGGIKTIHTVLANGFLNTKSRVLELGSNTGFTSVNIAAFMRCKVVGIDINKDSLKEARTYAKENKVDHLVSFKCASALELPFKNESFDLVWCSNVASFVENKQKFLSECARVLKTNGTLALIPIYYKKRPSHKLLTAVSRAVGTQVTYRTKKFWIDLVKDSSKHFDFQLFFDEDYDYINQKLNIPKYVKEVFNKPHLKKIKTSELKKLNSEYSKTMNLFNSNLQFARYSILLFLKKSKKDESELFLSKKV